MQRKPSNSRNSSQFNVAHATPTTQHNSEINATHAHVGANPYSFNSDRRVVYVSNCATAYIGHCPPLSTHFVYFHSFLGRTQHSINATKVKATLTYMMFRALGKPLGRHCSLWRDGFNCHCHPSCSLHTKGVINIIKIRIFNESSMPCRFIL